MKEEQFSRTAYRVAMRRASHQLLDDPKIFDDPLALRVLGPKAIAELQSDSREDSHLSGRCAPFWWCEAVLPKMSWRPRSSAASDNT